ncbi:Putative ATP-binding protein [Giardia duodenalis]|uniref:Putative ATP-binding protein n=1 Tax=Giardia intestinalis TaxID=5741 RepID=V6T8D7_GIAIN|nr:Putative ATP-binding protein [Giardia intestinalis]
MIHCPLPEVLRYNALLELEEDSRTEFKAVQLTNNLIDIVKNYCTKYLNAFINTYGGQLLLGVEDTGRIKGVVLSQRDKDRIRLAIDALINQTVPWVDAHIHSLNFIPVEDKQDHMSSGYDNTRYVIAISVSHGSAPLYFTSFTHKSAYVRRNGSIIKLSPDGIVRRFVFGRQTHLVADDYEHSVLDDRQKGLPRRFLKCCLRHQSIGFVGRGTILIDAVTFLHDTSQPQCTKVLTFYGQEYVGKTWLVEDLRSLIITDKNCFQHLIRPTTWTSEGLVVVMFL